MSHPPETSLNSRELAERLHKMWCLHSGTGHTIYLEKAADLIDAWVRVREASLSALIEKWRTECRAEDFDSEERSEYFVDVYLKHADELESALATARKQLEEKVK